MDSQIPFLIAATLLGMFSMRVNTGLTRTKISSDRAFWYSWLFMIWSAEIVTTVQIFKTYNQWEVTPDTRALALVTFLAAAIGFFIGSLAYSRSHGVRQNPADENKIAKFTQRVKLPVSLVIFIIGLYEYVTNQNKFATLLELRLEAVSGDLEISPVSLNFFYFAYAFVLLLGFADGLRGRASRIPVAMAIGGLIFHNLSIGGRINLVVAPALYMLPRLIMASQRPDWIKVGKPAFRRFALFVTVVIIVAFPMIQLFRSEVLDFSKVSSPVDFLVNVVFAMPMYVSDPFLSVTVHSSFAREAHMPLGYFTFDAFYRLFSLYLQLNLPEPNTVFGHAYFRNTAAPWAWTQTNMIPRLISDFGSLYWLAMIPIAAIAQWLSLCRFRIIYLEVALRSLILFSSAYSILGIPWFTAFNVYVLFYAMILYFLSRGRLGK